MQLPDDIRRHKGMGSYIEHRFSLQKSLLWGVECVCSVAQPCPTLCSPRAQAPLAMEFSRQEHWSGLPLPTPGDLPHPGIKPMSPALQVDSFKGL